MAMARVSISILRSDWHCWRLRPRRARYLSHQSKIRFRGEELSMIEVALMIEGQDGLNWPRWKALAEAAEGLGLAGLYRSDHFTNPEGPHKDALEAWISFAYLASETERIE